MKRPGMDDYKDFPKRQRNSAGEQYEAAIASGKFELRLLVGSKAAGAVIGKGGDNIKKLRSTFDATVSVPDSTSPERILTMVSTVENLVDMVKDILPRLDDSSSQQHGGGDGQGQGRTEVRMLVHQSHAGALIGRQGSKIKELREASHANIKVFSNCAPNSTDRVVLITGDDDAIKSAVKIIIETVRDIPIKGHTKQYDTMNYDPSFTQEYGGHAPPGGMQFRGPPMNNGGGGGPGMYAPRGGAGGGSRGAGGPMGGGPMGGAPFPPQNGGYPPMGGGGYGGPGAGGPGGPPVTTTQVTIPSELGGTIIGRGGERINRIREESGAHIVLEPHTGSDERIITISGTQTQIHAAQYLLQQCVRSSIAGRKYIGDGR